MEITFDLGEDILAALDKIAKIKNQSTSLTGAEMVSFGSRIFLQSLENKEDKTTKLLVENSVRCNEILVEIMHMAFNKERSKIGAYDAETALAIIERMVSNFTKGSS